MSAALSNFRFPGAGERTDRWVTVAQLTASSGMSARAIQLACKKGDLSRCHRWRDNPTGGPRLLEINLTAPTCPERYRKEKQDNVELGVAHQLTERQLQKATKLAALLEEIESL